MPYMLWAFELSSTCLGSAEIFLARYRDKSDLFDVYCKSLNIKIYLYLNKENYYHVHDRLIGVITKTFTKQYTEFYFSILTIYKNSLIRNCIN